MISACQDMIQEMLLYAHIVLYVNKFFLQFIKVKKLNQYQKKNGQTSFSTLQHDAGCWGFKLHSEEPFLP